MQPTKATKRREFKMIKFKVLSRLSDGTTIRDFHDTFAGAAGSAGALASTHNRTVWIHANIDGCHSGCLYKYEAGSQARKVVNKGFIAVVANEMRRLGQI